MLMLTSQLETITERMMAMTHFPLIMMMKTQATMRQNMEHKPQVSTATEAEDIERKAMDHQHNHCSQGIQEYFRLQTWLHQISMTIL
jgi:hypothetical protein